MVTRWQSFTKGAIAFVASTSLAVTAFADPDQQKPKENKPAQQQQQQQRPAAEPARAPAPAPAPVVHNNPPAQQQHQQEQQRPAQQQQQQQRPVAETPKTPAAAPVAQKPAAGSSSSSGNQAKQPDKQPAKQPATGGSAGSGSQAGKQPDKKPDTKPASGGSAGAGSQAGKQPDKQPAKQPAGGSAGAGSQAGKQPDKQPDKQPAKQPAGGSAGAGSQAGKQPDKQPVKQPAGGSTGGGSQAGKQPDKQPVKQPAGGSSGSGGQAGKQPAGGGTKPVVVDTPKKPANPIKPVVTAPSQVNRSPAEKQQAQQQAKQELKATPQQQKQAQQQKQKAAEQVHQATLNTQAANLQATQKAQSKAVDNIKKETAPVSTQQIQAKQAETAAKQKTVLADIARKEAARPKVAAVPKIAPPPELKTGSKFGLNPKVSAPANVAPPKIVAAVRDAKGAPVASYKATKEGQEIFNKTETQRNDFKIKYENNVTISNHVTIIQKTFVTNYNVTIVNRGRDFNHYYFDRGYHDGYNRWWHAGFYGGYYYPVVYVDPFVLTSVYFWNPNVYWLYADGYAPEYYAAWYGDYYYYRRPFVPFRYVHVFYPSRVFIDFATEITYYPDYPAQWGYRMALNNLADQLSIRISRQMWASFVFSPSDIVISHYRRLHWWEKSHRLSHRLYELDGYVDRASLHVPFKSIIDIDDPTYADTNVLFVPASPNPDDVENQLASADLSSINKVLAADNQPVDVAYEEPAPEQVAPATQYSCSTQSDNRYAANTQLPFSSSSDDLGTANQQAQSACSNTDGTISDECTANIKCDDGQTYAPLITCTAQSAGQSYASLVRDPDLAFTHATKFCQAADGTDADECEKSAATSCFSEIDTANALPQWQCKAYSATPTGDSYPGALSFDKTKAIQNAKEACGAVDGTNNDQCGDESLMNCHITNGLADIASQ